MSLEPYLCDVEDSISKCVDQILNNKERILFVCDAQGSLVGSLTEGDLVRALHERVSASHSVAGQWMNRHCFYLNSRDTRPNSLDIFRRLGHLAYPIVDDDMKVKKVVTLRDSLDTMFSS